MKFFFNKNTNIFEHLKNMFALIVNYLVCFHFFSFKKITSVKFISKKMKLHWFYFIFGLNAVRMNLSNEKIKLSYENVIILGRKVWCLEKSVSYWEIFFHLCWRIKRDSSLSRRIKDNEYGRKSLQVKLSI